MPTYTPTVASDKQVALINRLAAEKDLSGLTADQQAWLADNALHAIVTKRTASRIIDSLFACPRKPQAATEKAAPGYYTQGAEVFVVVENKAKTSTYAKRLEFTEAANGSMRPTWVYAPGLGKSLAGVEPLTAEAAGALGHLHGYCIICCRELTDPKSVQAGIGPVCAGRLA